jgi:hypothetical protein
MKLPSYDDLITLRMCVQNRLEHCRELADASDCPWATEEANALVRVMPWLDRESTRARSLQVKRCPQGRAHRVREIVLLTDGMLHRCRCGAERRQSIRLGRSHTSDWGKP